MTRIEAIDPQRLGFYDDAYLVAGVICFACYLGGLRFNMCSARYLSAPGRH
jgi:hypothetical protein